ncbi:MAG: peptide chain release factor-like protein [Tepidisphaeraceae bacterium]
MTKPPWELPDEKLREQCRFEAFVGPGPGGQKRHKTNAAVRYTHVPTGLHAMSSDSRSQRENRIHALRELRHKLAMELRRQVVDPVNYRPPEWWGLYQGLHVNPKNPHYPSVVAEVLDVLSAMEWSVAKAAVMLGVSTSAVVRFLHDDPHLWEKVNRVREELGMKRLRE